MSLNYSRLFWAFTSSMTPVSAYLGLSKKSLLLELCVTSTNSVTLNLPVMVDLMSTTFFLIVIIISANVMNFANMYMENEVLIKRFTHLVCALIMSMGLFIFMPNMAAILIGWDGLGLTSFLLVTLYSSNKSLSAGMLTALTNRIGDSMIILAIALSMETMSNLVVMSLKEQPYVCFCIMVAGMTKSAQFPLCSWLPSAMEAPTPVSALVHSSTLVTAGVYMMIRLHDILSQSQLFPTCMLWVGATTSIMASMCATQETDTKKIVALSTLSQLGLMVVTVAMGLPKLALFHMISHAMFKALLLICVGTMIHFNQHAQDIRQVSLFMKNFPLNSAAIMVAVLALSALPLMSGFYSKDAIIESMMWSTPNALASFIVILAATMTALYSLRLIYHVMMTSFKASPLSQMSEPMFMPAFSLSVGSAVLGASYCSMCNPMSLESFNPLTKITLISMVVLSTLMSIPPFVTSKSTPMHTCSMLSLTHLSTQKPLKIAMTFAKSVNNIDQSWLEIGQMATPSMKVKSLINHMASGTMIMSLGLALILYITIISVS